MRRIGVLMNLASDDPEAQARSAAFRQELQQLGWTEGRDVRIDYRWAGDASRFHGYAEELLALTPDVVLASATPSVQALRQLSRTVPDRVGYREVGVSGARDRCGRRSGGAPAPEPGPYSGVLRKAAAMLGRDGGV